MPLCSLDTTLHNGDRCRTVYDMEIKNYETSKLHLLPYRWIQRFAKPHVKGAIQLFLRYYLSFTSTRILT